MCKRWDQNVSPPDHQIWTDQTQSDIHFYFKVQGKHNWWTCLFIFFCDFQIFQDLLFLPTAVEWHVNRLVMWDVVGYTGDDGRAVLWTHVWRLEVELFRLLIQRPCRFLWDRWGSTQTRGLLYWNEHIFETSHVYSCRPQFCRAWGKRSVHTSSMRVSGRLHVGGGPLTYLRVRWKPRGSRLLRWHGGSRATQIRQASRTRAAARRR